MSWFIKSKLLSDLRKDKNEIKTKIEPCKWNRNRIVLLHRKAFFHHWQLCKITFRDTDWFNIRTTMSNNLYWCFILNVKKTVRKCSNSSNDALYLFGSSWKCLAMYFNWKTMLNKNYRNWQETKINLFYGRP
jgi:hypothetical protein